MLAVLAANQVQSALQAAALCGARRPRLAPVVGAPTGIRLGLMVAWGVSNGIYIALAQTLEVAVDCAETAFSNLQESTFRHDPANSDTVVPGSTQFSIDRLIASAGDTQATITAVQTTVDTVKTQTDSVDTAVTALNNILNDITDRVDEVQIRSSDAADECRHPPEHRGDDPQEGRHPDRQPQHVRERSSCACRSSRISTRNDEAPVGLFQLPAAFGGYLEVVKSIVTETLAKRAAIGNPSAQAMAFLVSANAAFAAAEYKTAYVNYRKAYGSVG